MKKYASIGMASILTLSSLFTATSGVMAESNPIVEGNSEFLVLKDTEEHTVIKFDNNDRLEIFNNDGDVYSYVETEGKKLKISKEDNKVIIVDTSNNRTIDMIEVEEVTTLPKSEGQLTSDSSENSNIGINAVQPNPIGDESSYKFSHTAKMSVDIGGYGLGVAVSICAAALGLGKGTSILTGIVSGAIALGLPKIYWKRHIYKYTKGIYRYEKHINQAYKYHDYTGYSGVQYAYMQQRIGVF